MLASGFAPISIYNTHTSLRTLLRRFQRADLCEAVPSLAKPKPRDQTFKAEEVEMLLAMASPPLQLAILLAHDAGLRSGTVVKVEHGHIAGHMLTIHTKRGTVAQVPISGRLSAIVASMPQRTGVPLLELLNGRSMGQCALEKRWGKLQIQCGLRPHRQLHDLRRTMARSVYGVCRDLRVVQQLLGHDSMASTLHYLHGASDTSKLRTTIEEVTCDKK